MSVRSPTVKEGASADQSATDEHGFTRIGEIKTVLICVYLRESVANSSRELPSLTVGFLTQRSGF